MGQTSPLLTPATQQLTEQKSAVASGAGTATFTFDSPPSGFVKSGTLQCLAAPTGAVFLATIGATQWGDWAGNSVAGPVQATANEQLVVTATGLTAGTTYLMSWIGSLDQEGFGQPEWPDPNSSVIAAAIAATLSTQGVVDTLGSNTNLTIPATGSNVALVTNFTALHAYSGVVVSILGTAAQAGALVSCQVVTIHPPIGQAIAWTGQVIPMVPDPLSLGSGTVATFLFPVGIAAGDSVTVELSSSVLLTPVIGQAFGITATPAVQVTLPAGLPLDTYQVGGSKQVQHTFAGAGNFTVLAAPPAGFVYRLHRLTCSAQSVILGGVTTAFTYGIASSTVPDNMMGAIANEALQFIVTAVTNGNLSYDLIPVQTLQ